MRELKEFGVVMTYAFNEPNKLDTLFKPHIEDTLERAAKNPDEWDYDEWWNTES